jgi:hypothetical protein
MEYGSLNAVPRPLASDPGSRRADCPSAPCSALAATTAAPHTEKLWIKLWVFLWILHRRGHRLSLESKATSRGRARYGSRISPVSAMYRGLPAGGVEWGSAAKPPEPLSAHALLGPPTRLLASACNKRDRSPPSTFRLRTIDDLASASDSIDDLKPSIWQATEARAVGDDVHFVAIDPIQAVEAGVPFPGPF